MGLYYEHPLELVGGSGSRVTDASGRSYLDFFCGILTNMLGYDLPEVRDAVQRQLSTGIVHTSTLYLIRSQVELAEKLARLSGIKDAKVFFTNSGTEANETALMLATTARRSNQVLAMRGSYHGRSFGAVAITGNVGWKSSQLAPFSVQYLHGTDRYLPVFASLSDALAAPVVAWTLGDRGSMLVAVIVMGLVLIARHHANIVKLLRGEESRIGEKASAS